MEPDRDDALATLDDATLRGIAYGRAGSARGISREAAARELALRYPPAPPVPVTTRASADADADAVTGSDDEDALPAPWWTRTRRIAAATFAASILAGALVGFGADRVTQARAADSLTIFDRPPTASEEDVAARTWGGASFDGQTPETRELARVGDVTIIASMISIDAGIVRSDVGERVCVSALEGEDVMFSALCAPRAVFDKQGIAGVLIEFPRGNVVGEPVDLRSVYVSWGPRGEATATLVSAGVPES